MIDEVADFGKAFRKRHPGQDIVAAEGERPQIQKKNDVDYDILSETIDKTISNAAGISIRSLPGFGDSISSLRIMLEAKGDLELFARRGAYLLEVNVNEMKLLKYEMVALTCDAEQLVVGPDKERMPLHEAIFKTREKLTDAYMALGDTIGNQLESKQTQIR